MESLANTISQVPTTAIEGVWQRHIPARYLSEALKGRLGRSRWGTREGFAILHLGAPTDSVVVEAYRHLVDPVEGAIAPHVAPRRLVTCTVNVSSLLDLRTATARISTGLSMAVLTSPVSDHEAYEACQEVAAVAHQLGLHGLIAPAATLMGNTLALFTENLPDKERPVIVGDELWDDLPPDPRALGRPRLRIMRDDDS